MKLSQSIAGDTKLVQDLLKEAVDERLFAPLRCTIISFNYIAFKLVVFVKEPPSQPSNEDTLYR
jgi:hypothetical protein